MTTVTMWCLEQGNSCDRHCYKPLRFSIDGSLSRGSAYDRNLVDPASSHMLVSKIKPCMSKYKHFILWNCEWLIKSVIVYLIIPYYLDNRGNSSANTCFKPRLLEGVYLLDKKPIVAIRFLVNHDNYSNRMALPAMVHSNFCPINFRW